MSYFLPFTLLVTLAESEFRLILVVSLLSVLLFGCGTGLLLSMMLCTLCVTYFVSYSANWHTAPKSFEFPVSQFIAALRASLFSDREDSLTESSMACSITARHSALHLFFS